MIVFDATTLVSATFRRDGVPARAVRHALRSDRVAVSEAVLAELLDVLDRPRLARFIDPELRAELVGQLDALGLLFTPTEAVADCRDAKDDKYLELALAAGAEVIVSGDADLLVLHPWRGVRVLRPADYLAEITGSA
ncbi:putative toxin-antitoxin system toxin component, PIN family [Paracraurococcus lichenis]|uniref:Toxin-antitoxin system toxin component, PIN family n=1 Tax=Paracraurococcus lichenis TaxID=3064888 RepID=A0ABT9ECJ9_9PROT|nr:putative toxin-antitoxin system toxin component, PIN family [Paracraurococcus sp. LOR1-02]MDO9713834.1 putative toxin-antitoxin system toxin component, PIN family [Paracraurococcus sp. LOR1-02]